MRQVLPSLLKNPHRGQESSICEFEKGAGGGRPSEASRLPRSVFSKSSFPKLTPHISAIFVHDEPIPKKKAFSSPRLKKFRRGSGGRAPAMALDTPRAGTRPSSDGPRYAADRDATPPGGLSGAERQVGGQLDELCDVFSPDSPPFARAWTILREQSPRSAQSKLDYSEKWQRTTRSVDHEVAGAWDMAGMWAGSGDSSRFAARPLAPLTSAPPSRAAHALLAAAGSCASSRLRVGQGQGDSSHLGVLKFRHGPLCEYEVATFVETEPQPSFMDSPAYPCNNQEAESYRGDKAKGDSIVI